METKYGVVMRVAGDRAMVRIDAEDAACGGCQSCSLKNLCQTRDPGHMDLELPVDPAAAPQIGDAVRVEYQAANQAVAAIVLFLPSLVGLAVGGAIANVKWPGSDALFLTGCGLGTALGLLCTFLLSRYASTLGPVARLSPSGGGRPAQRNDT